MMSTAASDMTVGQLFNALSMRLDTDAAAGINKTLQWVITDSEPGCWAFEISNGEGHLIEGGVEKADTTFITTAEIWMAVASGQQDAMKAFMSGKLKVEGDMMLALKVPELFATLDD